jgi:hypothetical protein
MRSRPVKNSDRLLARTYEIKNNEDLEQTTFVNMKTGGQLRLRLIKCSSNVTSGNTQRRTQQSHQTGYSRRRK